MSDFRKHLARELDDLDFKRERNAQKPERREARADIEECIAENATRRGLGTSERN